jgi:hypothetical protein
VSAEHQELIPEIKDIQIKLQDTAGEHLNLQSELKTIDREHKASLKDKCSSLKFQLQANQLKSQIIEEQTRNTKPQNDLDSAITEQQKETRAVCSELEQAVAKELDESEKLSDRLRGFNQQLHEQTLARRSISHKMLNSHTQRVWLLRARLLITEQQEFKAKHQVLEGDHQYLLCKRQSLQVFLTEQQKLLEEHHQLSA